MWNSWIFYQLMGCADALVDRGKRDVLIQHCIPLLRESLELMHSDHSTISFSEAWKFVEDSVIVERPGALKKKLFSYSL